MSLLVRAFPVRGSVQEVAAFIAALNQRKGETADFYRKYGIAYESWPAKATRHVDAQQGAPAHAA
jgi:hypothetical protein